MRLKLLSRSLKDKAEAMLPLQDIAYPMREFGIKDHKGLRADSW